jgi:cytochrome c biogenesis factor
MGLEEYLLAREMVSRVGEPLLIYILLLAALSFIVSLLSARSSSERWFRAAAHLSRVNALLFAGGFLLFAWYHWKIYQSVLIEYPAFLQSYLHVASSRFVIPLWIEGEKLYFWSFLLSLFVLWVYGKYSFSNRKTRYLHPALNLALLVLVLLMYLLDNPFRHPLPVVHSEIIGWYGVLETGDVQAIAGTSLRLFGRISFYYNSYYMWLHPPMLFIAYASLIVTFIACCFMLYQREREYDEVAYDFARVGYLFLTAGMLIGYPWAVTAWKGDWWWDPKINASVMMWVLYSGYLHTRLYARLWRVTALIGILCFASLVFTYLSTYVFPGIHSIAGAGGV